VSWNVFATPELSLNPRQWCFPIAGCVNYRGYFQEAQAKGESARLKAAGDDVYVGGVPAYSTLGWFDDPVLSSFVSWPETEIARLIFHELAHQLLYVKNDSTFNESFATAVEEALRWHSPVGTQTRQVTQRTEIAGVAPKTRR
jgi:predicted aminopeptidase